MVVARPIDPSSANFDPFHCTAPIVPTKILTDPEELDRQIFQNGYSTTFFKYMENSPENDENLQRDIVENGLEIKNTAVNNVNSFDSDELENKAIANNSIDGCDLKSVEQIAIDANNECDTPDSETEKYTVTLHKGSQGLGKK